MMSYIDLINNFWRLDFEKRFSLIQTRYYFLLLHYANKRHWKEALSLSNSRLQQEVLCSETGLKEARIQLVKRRMIGYKKGYRNIAGKYYIKYNPEIFLGSLQLPVEKENRIIFNKNIDANSGERSGEHSGNHSSEYNGEHSGDHSSNNSENTASYIRQDKNKIRGEKTSDTLDENIENFPYYKIIKSYNDICGEYLRQIDSVNGIRMKNLKNRWNEYPNLGTWETIFHKVVDSDYLSGRTKQWKATFDWIIKNQNNIVKVLDGNYDNFNNRNNVWEDLSEYDDDDIQYDNESYI